MDIPLRLQELLPDGYSYKLKKWFPKENEHFEAIFLANVYTENEAQEWWHKFNVKSNTTMRVRATCPKSGKVNSFKIFLRCLHQGRAEREKSEHSKTKQKEKLAISSKRNTNCLAGMIIAIRRLIKYSKSKMRDPVDPVHPCQIQLRFEHNHPIRNLDSLKFRPVSKEVTEKLLNLFRIGHSPTTALEILKTSLQMEHSSQYNQIVTDRYHCPDKSFCYRLYYKHFGKDYVVLAKKDVNKLLDDKILELNNALGAGSISKGILGTDYAIAVCTPIMKKAHTLPQSGETVHIEFKEPPNVNKHSDHSVILLIAHCKYGGVPLGALYTTSSNAEILSFGFSLLKQLLPSNAFFGRGAIGPHAFFISDSGNQRTAFHSTWPEADVVTCSLRLLQSVWRYLFEEKNNVLSDHRLYLLYLAKALLFATNESEMNDKFHSLLVDNIAIQYSQYLDHIKYLWGKQHLWAIHCHKLLPLTDSNNYFEVASRVHKDKLFVLTKQFNSVQILDYIITCVDLYYRTKLLDLLHNKFSHIFHTHFSNSIPDKIEHNIKQIVGNYFLVPSELDDKLFTVDVELNVCSCPVGMNGVLCLHQHWVLLKFPNELFKVGFCDSDFKRKLFSIVTKHSLSVDKCDATVSKIIDEEISVQTTELEQTTIIISPIFDKTNLSNSATNYSVSDILAHIQNNSEIISIPPDSSKEIARNSPCIQISDNNFVSDETSLKTREKINNENLYITKNQGNPSNTAQFFPASEIHLSTEVREKESNSDVEYSKRMNNILLKFEMFCDRVKEGLKTRPDDFLPALEIMMKTLERKGNSLDLIISGLSFFGVFSAPSIVDKRKRKCSTSITIPEELVPKVFGRQMNTYGKAYRQSNVQSNSTQECPTSISNMYMDGSSLVKTSDS